MNILTDEEIKAIDPDGLAEGFARSIEAAVLEKLKQQEPTTFEFQARDGKWCSFIDQRHYENTVADGSWPIRALYAAPVPAEDVVKQRDDLLAAFALFIDNHEECRDSDDWTAMMVSMDEYHAAQEAIASAKGGAA